MGNEGSYVALGLKTWNAQIDRAGKLVGGLSSEEILREMAPGRNRILYLWGHLTADPVSKFHFVEKKLQPIGGAEMLACECVRHRRDKAIDSDFHHVPSALKNALERWPDARNHENPENGNEKSQRQSCWRHEDVKAKYVEDDGPQNRKP
jgi:hypothetical protein